MELMDGRNSQVVFSLSFYSHMVLLSAPKKDLSFHKYGPETKTFPLAITL